MSIRTVEEWEKLQDKMYREITLLTHLPNFRRIYPNATEQTRTMAAFMYYVLYEQITGLQKSQTGCAAKFRCGTTPFKRLITGKRQPGRPGRSNKAGKSRRLSRIENATKLKVPGHMANFRVEFTLTKLQKIIKDRRAETNYSCSQNYTQTK